MTFHPEPEPIVFSEAEAVSNFHGSASLCPMVQSEQNEYLPNLIEKYSPGFKILDNYFSLLFGATLFLRRHLEAIIWYLRSAAVVARAAAYTTTALQRSLYDILKSLDLR